MGIYNIHAGHCPQGKGASGAVGILKESVEDRLVKNEVIAQLRKAGHTVYDCTCDENTTANGCLRKIVAKCNAHKVALDVSIHLNAGGGHGTEVWCYDGKTKEIAAKICANIAKTLGITNRGVKYSQSLYVLRKTKSPALLVECCFVDSESDAKAWNAVKCGKAIAEGIMGTAVSGTITTGQTSPAAPGKPKPAVPSSKLTVDGYWGKNTTKRLQQIFGTAADGMVSNQFRAYQSVNPGLDSGWEWQSSPSGYSPLIKAIQKKVGVTQDGHIGPKTIRAIQRWMGTTQDGCFSRKSPCIKKLQEWCNNQ